MKTEPVQKSNYDDTEQTSTPGLFAPEEFKVAPALTADALPWYKNKRRLMAIGAVALLLGGVDILWQTVLAPKKAAKEAAAPAVITVTTEAIVPRNMSPTVTVTGSVTAWDPLTISAEINGLRIAAVNVEEGDFVKKGQVLATLNSAVLRAQLEQARANLNAAEANVRKAIQPNRPQDILSYKAAVAQTQAAVFQEEAHQAQTKATLSEAKHNAQRYYTLNQVGAISAQEYENRYTVAKNAESELKNAEERVEAARFLAEQAKQKLKMAQIGGRSEDIQIAKASLAQMKATVDQLQAQVEQTIVRAPDDGLITKRDAHIGDVSTLNKPLFAMTRNNRLELRAQVPDVDVIKFSPGQIVEIDQTEGGTGLKVIGKVRQLTPQVDPTTRLGTVRIDLPADEKLRPGMFMRGIVKLGDKMVLAVPAKSIINRENGSHVFVLVGGSHAQMRPVRVGVKVGDWAEIEDGISSGEMVIVDGAPFLKDNDVVRVGQSQAGQSQALPSP